MAHIEFLAPETNQRRGGTGIVQIVRSGFQAIEAGGTRRMTRKHLREESRQQRFYLEVTFLLIVIGAIVVYSMPAGAPAPEPNAINGHLGDLPVAATTADPVQVAIDRADAATLAEQLDVNSIEDTLRWVRFNRTNAPGSFGQAELWTPAPDGLWQSQIVRVGDELIVRTAPMTVVRIDELLVVLRDADGDLRPVFNPRYWDTIRSTYGFKGRPFTAGLMSAATDGFWVVRTGTRSLYGVTLVTADGGRIPDEQFRRFVDDFERVVIDWRQADTTDTFRDRVEDWLRRGGPSDVRVK